MITREQYDDAKDACGDALVLFRMGDFYEAFFDDTVTLSRLCGLTLTTPSSDHVAGFPGQLLESYLRKIIAQGYRAAVCEQQAKLQTAWCLVRELSRGQKAPLEKPRVVFGVPSQLPGELRRLGSTLAPTSLSSFLLES